MEDNINFKLNLIDYKLDQLLSRLDVNKIIELLRPFYMMPEQYRLTYEALFSLKEADATQVSILTHKARAVESGYLNSLVGLGFASKYRKGRSVKFTIKTYL